MRLHYYHPPDDLNVFFCDWQMELTIDPDEDIGGLRLTTIKTLIRRSGGSVCT